MPEAGDVILCKVQFTDTFEVKRRPALVLFKEYGNIVVAGITSNLAMEGIRLTRKDGAIKESVIKLNYIFTISEAMVGKVLFSLPNGKRKEVFGPMAKKMQALR